MSLEAELNSGLSTLAFLELSTLQREDLIESLSAYIRLLDKWGQVMNLTAIRSPSAMVERHMMDSLKLVPYLKNSHHILDVGTGAGLPGIPLSLVLKEKQFTLLDSHLKKQLFLERVCQVLKLQNVSLQCIRVESYRPTVLFDTIISRAFASLEKMLSLTGHLLAPQGRFLAMKGKIDPDELTNIGTDYTIESVINLQLTDHQPEARHLIVIKRIKEE